MNVDYVKRLKMQSGDELLRMLVTKFEDADGDQTLFPLVSVAVGQLAYSGVPVKIETIRGEPWLALLDPEGGLNGLESLTMVPLKSVHTVTVQNLRTMLPHLAEGMQIDTIGEVPARFAIERELSNLTTLIEGKAGKKRTFTIDWNGAEGESAARYAINELMIALQMELTALYEDPMGKDALKPIERFTLRYIKDNELQVMREGNEIAIHFGQPIKARRLATDVRTALEAKL